MQQQVAKAVLIIPLVGISTVSCSLLDDYPQNPLISEYSSKAYIKCDELASDILQVSYDGAGEYGGRFTNFLSRSKKGSVVLYQLSEDRQFKIISDNDSVAIAVYGTDFFGQIAISAAKTASKNSKQTIGEFIGEHSLPANSDPREILTTNESLVCKVKFMAIGLVNPGFYRISEDAEGYYYEQVD